MSEQIDPAMYISEYKACFGKTPIRLSSDKDYEAIVSQKMRQQNQAPAKQEVTDYYEKIVAQKIQSIKKSQDDAHFSCEESCNDNKVPNSSLDQINTAEVNEISEQKSTASIKKESNKSSKVSTKIQDKPTQKKKAVKSKSPSEESHYSSSQKRQMRPIFFKSRDDATDDQKKHLYGPFYIALPKVGKVYNPYAELDAILGDLSQ